MNKKIALTGATGFLGQHLLNHLIAQGYIINALTRKPQKELKNVKWVMGDFESL